MAGAGLGADLALAREAAREAAALLAGRSGRDPVLREKGPDQPLTVADLEADRLLRARLSGPRPDYGWLSEETADDPVRLRRRRVWIVDPLDGTRSFLEGRPEFAVSIGLVEDGVAVVGVVCNPASGELFWAVRGEGAWVERVGEEAGARRLAVRAPAEGEGAVLFASRRELVAGEFEAFRGRWAIRPLGSTAYKLAQVAAGEGDAYLSRGPKSEWDVCAGALLVEEAGGRATDLWGRALRYNAPEPSVQGIVAAGPRLHGPLLALVRSLGPAARPAGGGDRDGG